MASIPVGRTKPEQWQRSHTLLCTIRHAALRAQRQCSAALPCIYTFNTQHARTHDAHAQVTGDIALAGRHAPRAIAFLQA